MMIATDIGDTPYTPGGSYGGGTGSGTGGTGSTSGSTTGTTPGGVAQAIKVLFFRVGFDMERMPIERWAYSGPFVRPEIQATVFNDSGIFHPIPDGVVSLDLAPGEVVRWSESADPGALVDSLDTATAIEDLHQPTIGLRVTRQLVEPFQKYLRAIIIGPAAGLLTKIEALGDYDHPPATMIPGRLITVVK
ncbi:hypothetical protein [Geothrix campi]|uniref:hypothetical protein n=1 Tax=Geothrix campi TaxID=2966450 RepID=UPI00214739C6|nr:hypothetical protein [Geothrix sp. SG10]